MAARKPAGGRSARHVNVAVTTGSCFRGPSDAGPALTSASPARRVRPKIRMRMPRAGFSLDREVSPCRRKVASSRTVQLKGRRGAGSGPPPSA